jgi:hypothetical protein
MLTLHIKHTFVFIIDEEMLVLLFYIKIIFSIYFNHHFTEKQLFSSHKNAQQRKNMCI